MSKKSFADPAFAGRTDAPHAPMEVDAGRLIDQPQADPAAEAAPPKPAVKQPAVMEAKFKPAEIARMTWRVVVPAATSVDELSEPRTWLHVVRRLTPGDLVEVLPEDTTYIAFGIVRSTDVRAGAVVDIYASHALEKRQASGSALDIEHVPGLDWTVVRKADKARVAEGLKSQADAYTWLAQNAGRI